MLPVKWYYIRLQSFYHKKNHTTVQHIIIMNTQISDNVKKYINTLDWKIQ